MILPLGHEQTSVRRLPWVTFSIMIACVLAWALAAPSAGRAERRLEERAQKVFQFFREHPYLELDDRLRERIPAFYLEQFDAALEVAREFGPKPPGSRREVEEEQRTFTTMVDELFEARDLGPYARWGLIPDDMTLHGLVTYQFMHGGFWHLLGNMFLLYLAGPFIEDVWGRPLFGAFYLGAGIVAALFFALRYPGFDGPLIGASGAVAGVMGAFLVRFWKARIRFLYWLFFFFVGTFTAPAWLMLPLWFLKELFTAQAMDVVAPGSGGGGVAYWAHVAGFGFGAAVAVAIGYWRVEERFIDRDIEAKITLHDNPAVEDAMTAAAAGRLEEGAVRLEEELERDPRNLDAAVALLSICERRGDARVALPHLLRGLEHVARDGGELVAIHWPTIVALDEEIRLEPATAVRLAEPLRRTGLDEMAADVVARAAGGVAAATAPGVAVRLARLAVELELPAARRIVDGALEHPEMPPDTAAELRRLRGRAGEPPGAPLPAPVAVDSESERAPADPIEVVPLVPGGGALKSLRVMEAVPVGLDGDALALEVRGQRRRLSLGDVQAIAVGGIRPATGSPYLVVDLALDSVLSEQRSLRVVRLLSNRFDPRPLTGQEQSLAAFRALLDHLVQASEAIPLPDPDGAVGRPFRSFGSLEAYEREVLGAG